MSQQVEANAVVSRTITVRASQEHAFQVFTEHFGSWWPKEYSIGEADMADFVLEPKVDGRWYEVGVDGTKCETGRVTAYEPPDRLVLAWHLDDSWRYDPDPAHASEVEVRFIAEPGRRGSNLNTATSDGTVRAPLRCMAQWMARAGGTSAWRRTPRVSPADLGWSAA
jgi:uncharacterized protein YndB with AHSA1/START domain